MGDAGADERRQDRSPLLVFLHIPKTAGTRLTRILRENAPGEGLRTTGNVFKGGGGVKEGVTFEGLRSENAADLERVKILTGHIPLGMRAYLPEDRDLRCFTFLREPTDRTLSHFFAIRDRREAAVQEPNKLGLSPLPPDATLNDALESGHIHDNLHTRMLSGLPEPFGKVDDEMLERAKRNLREELVFFGITERFDESLVLAKRRLGLQTIGYQPGGTRTGRSRRRASGRVNTNRPRGDAIPGELAEAAERCNRYDIELYRYAQELFDSLPERSEPQFDLELTALLTHQLGQSDEEVVRLVDGLKSAWGKRVKSARRRVNAARRERRQEERAARLARKERRQQEKAAKAASRSPGPAGQPERGDNGAPKRESSDGPAAQKRRTRTARKARHG